MLLCVLFVAHNIYADDIKQPVLPKQPTMMPSTPPLSVTPAPQKPQDSGRSPATPFIPVVPPAPAARPAANEGSVYETASYDLSVKTAYLAGNTKNPITGTINFAKCTYYSDNSIKLQVFYKSGETYTYYLKNAGAKIDYGGGVFRVTYDTLIQIEKKMLLDKYTSEVYTGTAGLKSINVIGNNALVIYMEFTKK
jgi:hypothetical protein